MSQYIIPETTRIFSSRRALCTYLVQEHHEACHEDDLERLTTLCQRFGIVEYVEPEHVPTPEEISARKKSLISAISNAAREVVESQANAALQDQMWSNYKSATPHPYVVANLQWGASIAMEAEIRKAQVQAGIADDAAVLCDFSAFGEKPYSVYQLYMAGVVVFPGI